MTENEGTSASGEWSVEYYVTHSFSPTALACIEVVSKGLTKVPGSVSMATCKCGWVFYCGWKRNKPHDPDCIVLTCFRAVVNEHPGPWFSFRCDRCAGAKVITVEHYCTDHGDAPHLEGCPDCEGTGKNPIGGEL